MPRPLNPEAYSEFETLYHEGMTDKQIADATGYHPSTILSWRNRQHLPHNWTPENRHRPEFVNFRGCVNVNARMQAWFAQVGAETPEQKQYALKVRARELRHG
jgi:uncharacterized protein YjcR